MSNSAQGVADWLLTLPGLISGKSREEVVAAAYDRCPTRMPAESSDGQLAEFEKILKMLGHAPRSRNRFDEAGNSDQSQVYWELPLPGERSNG